MLPVMHSEIYFVLETAFSWKVCVGCYLRCILVIYFILETAFSWTVRKDTTTLLAGHTLALSSRIWTCKFIALLRVSMSKKAIVCMSG
jgi:hypothetical protein